MSDNEPNFSERGFQHFDPVRSSPGYPGEVRVYESSAAREPCIWIDSTDGNQAPAHLTLEGATKVRDQLTYLIENHYQVLAANLESR